MLAYAVHLVSGHDAALPLGLVEARSSGRVETGGHSCEAANVHETGAGASLVGGEVEEVEAA